MYTRKPTIKYVIPTVLTAPRQLPIRESSMPPNALPKNAPKRLLVDNDACSDLK